MRYALVVDGVVANIIRLHPMNADSFLNAVATDDLPVAIGDTYADGVFYHDGEVVMEPSDTSSEEMEDMKEALALLGVTVDE